MLKASRLRPASVKVTVGIGLIEDDVRRNFTELSDASAKPDAAPVCSTPDRRKQRHLRIDGVG